MMPAVLSHSLRTLLSAGTALAVLCLLYGCSPQNHSPALAPDTLYRVIDDEVGTLDPQKVSTVTDIRVATDLFAGLTAYGPDGRIVPGLAERWTSSPSGKIWTFDLRRHLHFSDGTPITADDVVASLRRAVDPQTAAPMAKLLFPITQAEAIARTGAPLDSLGVRAQGPQRVIITLVRPAPEILEVLAHPVAALVPTGYIARTGEAWSKGELLVVSGPFKPFKRTLHASLELHKNPHYFNHAQVGLARVIYYPMSDKDAAIRKFRAHEADLVADFSRTHYDVLKRELPQTIHMTDYRGSYYFVFNTRKPPFEDPRVRCALSMVLNRDILAHQVAGLNHQPSVSIVPASLPHYGPPVVPHWATLSAPQRMNMARHLLTQAGYNTKNPLRFEIKFNSSDDHKRMALALAQMWKPLGVQVQLFNTESSVHFSSLKSGDFALARSGWIADYSGADNFLSIYTHNAGVLNYSGFDNPRFDSVYEEALNTPEPTQRTTLLRQAESIVAESCAVLPLYTYKTKNLVSGDVQGWVDNVSNINPSQYLTVLRKK